MLVGFDSCGFGGCSIWCLVGFLVLLWEIERSWGFRLLCVLLCWNVLSDCGCDLGYGFGCWERGCGVGANGGFGLGIWCCLWFAWVGCLMLLSW